MKPTTVREALIDYFKTLVEKQPEMADRPYLVSSKRSLTPGQIVKNQAVIQELEKEVIKTTIELVVRGKESLPNDRRNQPGRTGGHALSLGNIEV